MGLIETAQRLDKGSSHHHVSRGGGKCASLANANKRHLQIGFGKIVKELGRVE
jgi:hypothetical protein